MLVGLGLVNEPDLKDLTITLTTRKLVFCWRCSIAPIESVLFRSCLRSDDEFRFEYTMSCALILTWEGHWTGKTVIDCGQKNR
jgi:hypothetical protein